MIKVYIKKKGNYAVRANIVKKKLTDTLTREGIVSDSDVSVSFVGVETMKSLAQKYLKEKDVVHNVLSFPFLESNGFVDAPGDVIHLGDIIVCYPKVVEEASREGMLIEEKILELIDHSALHLMGKHHE